MRLLALLPVVALTACGGGGPDPQVMARKAAYVTRAEAVCEKANTARRLLHVPATTSEVPGYVHGLVQLAVQDVTALEALQLPTPDAVALRKRFLTPLRQQADEAEAFDRRMQGAKGDSAVQALLAVAPTKTRADLAFLRSYGFHACVTAADTSR